MPVPEKWKPALTCSSSVEVITMCSNPSPSLKQVLDLV
jgi:hypothetical protein